MDHGSRARYLTPEHLVRAIKAGDFYASSGVTLVEINFDEKEKTLSLQIEAEDGVSYTTQFIGTPTIFDESSEPRTDKDGKEIRATRKYSSEVGQVFATVEGSQPQFTLTGNELYVRAVVSSNKPHADPSFDDQKEQAWTQPVGWDD